jgi:hypothetical protein
VPTPRAVSLRVLLVLTAAILVTLATSLMVRPSAVSASGPLHDEPTFAFTPGECGPPSTTIPGPPPELIAVDQPMNDSWLMCYIQQDFEGQTFFFERWGEAYKAAFRGYPVECWSEEIDPAVGGRLTDGIVAKVYGWNLDRTQYVRFTYRIQLDGDYINNCGQEILPTP